MGKNVKRIWKGFALGILLLLAVSFGLFAALKNSFNPSKIVKELNEKGIFPDSVFIEYQDYRIHCEIIGNKSLPKVLLIHGSPGSWSDFKMIVSDSLLQGKYCLITFDRPGYGRTSVPAQEQLSQQAMIVNTIIDHFSTDDEKFILVGHSYGGAVLEQCLIDFPDKIKHAIYAAPCLSPKYQKAKWYNTMISGGLPNKIMPKELKNSNHEMMALSACLTKNETLLNLIATPTTYIQGKKDILVPYETLYYYQNYSPNIAVQLIPDMNHFIPWSDPKLIVKAILNSENN